ncbi:protein NLRC3-like [Engraulis encrasicolus]|uniref:protein NLRC3-like n=1 Tax=Engraulis encrasicolus TaxID=184585 RepID=UPI002FD64C9E
MGNCLSKREPDRNISAQGRSNVSAPVVSESRAQRDINISSNVHHHYGAETSTPAQPAQKTDGLFSRCQQELKDKLSKKFHNVHPVIPRQGGATSLEEIYTELYITEGECEEVSTEHEVRQIEMTSKIKTTKRETPIKPTDIFKCLSGEKKHIRVVMTKGVAGIGKTISVQKFILDWAKPDQEGAKPDEDGAKPDEDGAKQDIDFLFPVSFREINQMEEKEYTLIEFIHHFFGETSDLIFSTDEKYKITFIFDGLDESRLPLHFGIKCIYNVTDPATVDVLLTNLIKGNLLPSAQIWITSRPAAANQIPPECVDQVTEVRGFTDQQKEKYFQKNINKQEMVSKIIRHLKRSRSLYIMCHIPVFCWIAATVLVSILTRGKSDEIPASLTQMYIHFLITQVKYISQKYKDIWNQKTILSLGRLAFQQLEKGNLIFYEKDMRECGMDAKEASDYSGVCTQIFREDESGLYQEKVFSFVHLSIQEFLAALYVFLCNRDRNMSDQQQTSELSALFRAATPHDLHKTAVDLALQRKDGYLDLFLRFLLGLSLESNQKHLQDLLSQNSSQSQNSLDTVQYVKKKIRGQRRSERGINLFYCLNELNQHAVVEHIDREKGQLSVKMLLPGEWKTVEFQLTMSEEHLDGFDLQKYLNTPEKDQTDLLSPDDVLQKLVPVVTTSIKAE